MLPSDWHRTTVGESATFMTGFAFASAEFESSGVRLLRGSNVKRSAVDWNPEITQHWPRSDSALRTYELKAGDIVIAMDGALVGRSFARISERDLPAYLVQRVARLRGSTVDQSLLYAWITSSSFATHIDSLKTNSAIPHLSPHDIRGFAFISPSSTDEQRSIAAAIDDSTDLIVSLERLIAKKRAMKQGMMQQLLTGKTRLQGFDTPWRETTLGAVCRIKTGKRNNQDKNEGGRYPFYVRSATVERIDSFSYDCEAILVPGEGNIGSIFHYMDGKFEVHQRVYKISDFTDEVVGKFVFHFMRQFFGKHAMENSAKATVDSLRLPTFK
jgi:type I restriction enzyme S subunit